jgi:hypothetical protein
MEKENYQGWKNRQTWNVALWIGNDEPLYSAAVDFVKRSKSKRALYPRFIKAMGMENDRTPDNIAWLGTRLSYKELNDMMIELAGE